MASFGGQRTGHGADHISSHPVGKTGQGANAPISARHSFSWSHLFVLLFLLYLYIYLSLFFLSIFFLLSTLLSQDRCHVAVETLQGHQDTWALLADAEQHTHEKRPMAATTSALRRPTLLLGAEMVILGGQP